MADATLIAPQVVFNSAISRIIENMLGLIRWLSHRSLGFLHRVGGWAGWLTWALSPSYRQRLRENAELAGVTARDRRASVAQAGRLILEIPRLWSRAHAEPIADPVRWEGSELIDRAVQEGRGLVLLTPHMGSFEVAGQAYAERFGAQQPMTVLYRPARQAWVRAWEDQARARPHLSTAPANVGGVRQLLRALKRGETLGLLPDQVPPEGQGVWSPFFGKPAYTMTLAARLVHQTGAAVLCLWCERLPHGQGYVVRVSPMAHPLPSSNDGPFDEAQGALAINRSMEALILQCPSQYLWGYHRYKTPRGAP